MLATKDIHKFWSFLRSKFKPPSPIPPIESGDSIIFADSDKAEKFRDYFSSVYENDNGTKLSLNCKSLSVLDNISFDVADVFGLLDKLDDRYTLTPDGIPSILLRRLAASLALPLYISFNESLKTGKVPFKWKNAFVIPVHKSGSKAVISNYRPISLTSILCRLLEKLVRKEIHDYCDKNSFINKCQFGFVKHRSVLTQLLTCFNCWTKAMDHKELVKIVYIDFKKAFDKISHIKLIEVLKSFGISGSLLAWLIDFLNERTQQVWLNGTVSSKCDVLSGVPQGSVLGPLLFNLFINDLPLFVHNCHVFLFADDCKIFKSFPKHNSDFSSVQSDLNSISDFCQRMQMQISVNKCQVLTLNGGQNDKEYSFYLSGFVIPNVEVVRDLGLLVDSKFSFTPHCLSTVKKLSRLINFIFRTFKSRNSTFLIRLYKCYVLPLLDYCCQLYFPCTLKNIKLLESIQKVFTRRLCGQNLFHATYFDRLKHFSLESLERRRIKYDLILLYRLIYGFCDLNVSDFISFSPNVFNTRGNGLKINIEHFNSDFRRHFYFNRVAKVWNELPQSVVTAFSIGNFKSHLDSDEVSEIIDKFLRYTS